jgi:hypothetical protein
MSANADVATWIASAPRVFRPGFTVADDRYFGGTEVPARYSPEPPPPAGVFTARTEAECWQLAYQSFRRSFPAHTLDEFKTAMIFIGPAPQFVGGRFVIDLEVSP